MKNDYPGKRVVFVKQKLTKNVIDIRRDLQDVTRLESC